MKETTSKFKPLKTTRKTCLPVYAEIKNMKALDIILNLAFPHRALIRTYKKDKKTSRSAINTIYEEFSGTQCILRPGSIVACDLAMGTLDHTGIYIGRNRIVERNGCGRIRKVSIKEFTNSSTLRSGVTLYAACVKGKVIASPEIAKRAREAVETDYGYHLISNNCHKLTAYLATGRRHNITTFTTLASILDTKYPGLEWKSAIAK